MALKIRLRQQGRKNRAFYRLVVTDSRSPRDGKYLEALGWYNPIESEAEKISLINQERIMHWLDLGAKLSERAASMIAKTAPEIVNDQTQKEVARREKKVAKRKAQKKA